VAPVWPRWAKGRADAPKVGSPGRTRTSDPAVNSHKIAVSSSIATLKALLQSLWDLALTMALITPSLPGLFIGPPLVWLSTGAGWRIRTPDLLITNA